MSELSYWINDDTNPADAVARARQVDSDEWIEFVDHFYQSCCDCGLTHRINIRNKTVGKKEVQFVRRDDLSCLMRDRLGKARTDALDARDAEIARLTAELAQTQRDRQAEHDLRVTMQGEAETLRARLAAAERDAERFVWLTEDHAGAARHMRNSLLERMAVMSTSAVRAAVDAARGGA